MHLFTGHKLLGEWKFQDAEGRWHIRTPTEVERDNTIVWVPTEDSGEFYWPHLKLHTGKLIEMIYDEQIT